MTTMLRVRKDALDTHPEDEGCEYHDRCLTCPFPACLKHEYGTHGKQAYDAKTRADAIHALADTGVPRREIVRRLGVSLRTVDRGLAARRDAMPTVPGPDAHELRQS